MVAHTPFWILRRPRQTLRQHGGGPIASPVPLSNVARRQRQYWTVVPCFNQNVYVQAESFGSHVFLLNELSIHKADVISVADHFTAARPLVPAQSK